MGLYSPRGGREGGTVKSTSVKCGECSPVRSEVNWALVIANSTDVKCSECSVARSEVR